MSAARNALDDRVSKALDAGKARAERQRGSVGTEMRSQGPSDRPPADGPVPHQVPPRIKPVKVTVELQPVEHRKLKDFCAATADELQLPLVAGAEVLRVLWDLARRDPELAARVRAELARTGGSRRR